MVNYISHNLARKVHFDDQEEVKSEKKFNLSFAGVSDNASTHATDAEYTPDSDFTGENFGTQLNVILEKGESQYEAPRLRTDDEVNMLRAKLAAKSAAYDDEADYINGVRAQADAVQGIVEETNAMIDGYIKAQQDDLNEMYRQLWGLEDN